MVIIFEASIDAESPPDAILGDCPETRTRTIVRCHFHVALGHYYNALPPESTTQSQTFADRKFAPCLQRMPELCSDVADFLI